MTGLELLIWYAMPGGVCALALFYAVPSLQSAPSALWGAAIPLLGYAIHQLFRTLFEVVGGWEKPKLRSTLVAIKRIFKLSDTEQPSCDPFLIWEMTFYSDGFPEPFRQRDMRAWHYIMSFWAVAFACVIAVVILFVSGIASDQSLEWSWLVVISVLGVVFAAKGALTKVSLMRLECAALERYADKFEETKKTLCKTTDKSEV